MEPSFLSLVPPLVTIGLAITTKRIFLSLGIGIALGALFYNEWNIVAGAAQIAEIAGGLIYAEGWITEEVYILLFILMLGVLTCFIRMLGGAQAFSEWASTKVRTRFQAQLATIVLGFLIFFDDAFSSLVVGNVSRPLFDKYRISRAKLSYLVDSTAAPVIIMTPISGWAAFIASVIAGLLASNEITDYSGYEAYLLTIPTNYYAITALLLVFAVAYFGINFGPMRKHEKLAREEGILFDASKGRVPGETDDQVPTRDDGKVGDLVTPVLTLIGATVVVAAWIGISRTDGAVTPMTVLANTDVILSLAIGGLASCLVALAKMLLKRNPAKQTTAAFLAGVKSMLPAAAVLFLAWITAEIVGLLGVGEYLGALADGSLALSLLPVIFFLLSAVMSFSIGSTFGTFGLMLPIGAEIAASVDVSLLIPVFGAVLAGSIFGDHTSPLSDTTILSSVGSGIHLMDHVTTQLPYGLACALASSAGYIALGITKNMAVGLVVTLAALAVIILVLKSRFSDRASPLSEPASQRPAEQR
ncbi:MAG: Na+/H+ antiporter NhaC family protein [Carbonactinosporaceae bacterium]